MRLIPSFLIPILGPGIREDKGANEALNYLCIPCILTPVWGSACQTTPEF